MVVSKRYYINTLKQELGTVKTYEHNRQDETSIVDRHRCHIAVKFGLFVDEDHSKLPTLYWLPKLHKRPFKSSCLILFDLILYVHSTIFQLCGTGLPGLNQY